MTEYLQVANWDKYQHYRHRSPPWIKLHQELLASEDWVMLADASKLLMVVCMLVAAKFDGRVPNSPHYFKRVAYLDKMPDLTPLIETGFLVKLQADASTVQADASDRKRLRTNATPEKSKRESKSREEKKGKTLSVANGSDPGFDALWNGWVPYHVPKGSRKRNGRSTSPGPASMSSWCSDPPRSILSSQPTAIARRATSPPG